MSSCGRPRYRVVCDALSGALHLRINEGFSSNWTVLFGASGSGKSTLLRLIAGLWAPKGSTVSLDGQDLSRTPAHKRGIGLVAQQPALFPNMTVRDNIAFGCSSGSQRDGLLPELLETFELRSLADNYPSRLSGGEQQRTALARALAARPRLLLLDEAFTGMHRTQQQRLIGAVRDSCTKLSTPVLSVTHDVAEAFLCSEEVVRIESGAIIARGKAREVLAEERAMTLEHLTQPTPRQLS